MRLTLSFPFLSLLPLPLFPPPLPPTASPFYQKTLHLLAHYGVSYDVVQTAAIPPRPMLSEALNITYRRIPLLVLDGEVHIDTAHIARALDATFGDKPGHGHSLLARSPVVQQHASCECGNARRIPTEPAVNTLWRC